MALNRILLTLLVLGLFSACADNPVTNKPEPPQPPKQQENKSRDVDVKQLELKASLNDNGTVMLDITNHSTLNADTILVGLRLRFSARIVSDILFNVPQDIKAGQSLLVDTEIAVPNRMSIIRAEMIEAKFTP